MVDYPEDAWIQVYTGGKFHPLAPKVSEVPLVDIAHALAMKCRFSGLKRSVARSVATTTARAVTMPRSVLSWTDLRPKRTRRTGECSNSRASRTAAARPNPRHARYGSNRA